MALTQKQQAAREGLITASFLPALVSGDVPKILNEWRRIIGDPNYIADDLSDSWPVQFGSYIESFALDWHEKKTGQPLDRRGEFVLNKKRPYFGCTLDAYRASDSTVIDCKAPGMWRKIEDVTTQYTCQMIGQKACVGADKASLLIVHGGSEPAEYPMEWTAEYEEQVWALVDQFQACVESLTPPVSIPVLADPVVPVRIVQMDENPEWKKQADRWLQTFGAVQTAKDAEKIIKGMVPEDAIKAIGAGIMVTRNKAGALSLRENRGSK